MSIQVRLRAQVLVRPTCASWSSAEFALPDEVSVHAVNVETQLLKVETGKVSQLTISQVARDCSITVRKKLEPVDWTLDVAGNTATERGRGNLFPVVDVGLFFLN